MTTNHNSVESMRVSIRIPKEYRLPLSVFGEVISRFNVMLETIERESLLNFTKPGFELEGLHSSDPTVLIVPAGDQPKHEVFDAAIDAIEAATAERWEDWPQSFASSECVEGVASAVKSALTMGNGLDVQYRVRKATARKSAVKTFENWARERKIWEQPIPGIGRVEGKLDSITVHSKMQFNVWRSVDGRRFECELDEEQFENAKNLLRKTVGVEGKVFDTGLASGSKITHITSLIEVTSNEPISAMNLYGAIPDLMGDMTPEEYWVIVRGNRSYDD